jgi:catechol 2,3-dioxygenase
LVEAKLDASVPIGLDKEPASPAALVAYRTGTVIVNVIAASGNARLTYIKPGPEIRATSRSRGRRAAQGRNSRVVRDMSTAHDPIHDIAHLGHVELMTPKLEESLWYFTELLGMAVTDRGAGCAYLRGYGDYAHTTLKLTAAAEPGVGHIAWRARSPAALERRVTVIEREGLGIGWINGDLGHGPAFQFTDPDGHRMEVYFEERRYAAPDGLRSTLRNLPMKYPSHGIGVRRTDHLALLCRDVARNRRFAAECLGFALREQVVYENGTREIGSWMSPSPIHHELAYVLDTAGEQGRLHHFSLWTDNRDDVLRAADVFMENGIFIEAGPSKHNNSQAFYVYSYEPGGNRIEIYTGSFLVFAPDFETVVWDETARGTGVYWGAPLPESFLRYATPPLKAGTIGARREKGPGSAA